MDFGQIFSLLKSAKAYVAAAVAFGGCLLMLAQDESTTAILPDNWEKWMLAVGTALVAFGGVFGIRNARTVSQAQEDLRRAKNMKVPKAPSRRKVRRAAKKAPAPASEPVEPQGEPQGE